MPVSLRPNRALPGIIPLITSKNSQNSKFILYLVIFILLYTLTKGPVQSGIVILNCSVHVACSDRWIWFHTQMQYSEFRICCDVTGITS